MDSLLLQDLIRQIAKDNGIENYTVDTNKSASKEGDGYIGVIEALNIRDKDSDKKLSLVVKRAPESENLRKQFPTRPAFLREIVIYDEIFPEFKKFQEEHHISKPLDYVPTMYAYIKDEFKELLLLNNLKEDGFRLCNRREPMSSEHLSLGVATYAKFHAISHAMKRLDPERYERTTKKIKHNIMDSFMSSSESLSNPSNKDMANGFFASPFEAVKDTPRLFEAMERIKNDFFEGFFMEMSKMADDEFSVVTHSDCWSANILFKYEDESSPNIPTAISFIDWQMSCLSHPVQDISYFFYINAGKEDLRNYVKYLKMYHAALCESLAAYGLEPNSFYPFDVLEEQWKKNSKLGFFMCLVMLQQSLSETKTHDFEQMANEGKDVFDLDWRKNEVSDLYKQRMSDLVEILVDHDFI